MSEIKKAEQPQEKRMNLNVPVDLHNSFKATTAAQGQNMTDVLLEFIQQYVANHGIEAAERTAQMKRAVVIYEGLQPGSAPRRPNCSDLRQMAAQRGYQIVQEYTDRISGAKARRPGLDQMMTRCPPRPVRCRPGLGLGPDRPLREALP